MPNDPCAPVPARPGLRVTPLYSYDPEALPLAGPLGTSPIRAGFPSPAEDFQEETLDLNRYLIRHPAATFFARVEGDSMIHAGIQAHDLLVIDRALTPAHGHIVVAVLDGELLVKRLSHHQGQVFLCSEHPDYEPLEVSPESDFRVWGVVTYVIHPLWKER